MTVIVVIAIVAIYSLGLAAWDYLAVLAPSAESRYRFVKPHFEFLLWDRFIEAVFGCWFFFTGSAIGSFLNVVVYRMPMGLSLISKGSRCPYCLTPILARDNLPIIGWLGLRGRCRACRLPISPRYPIVEALTGLMFLMVFGAELVNGGRFLPNSWFVGRLDIGGVILDARWDLLAIYLYHMFFLCCMWSVALMVFDGRKPPLRFWLTAVLVSLGSVAAWPWIYPWLVAWAGGIPSDAVTLYPVPAWPISGHWPVADRSWMIDPITAVVGAVGGAGAGSLLVWGVQRFAIAARNREVSGANSGLSEEDSSAALPVSDGALEVAQGLRPQEKAESSTAAVGAIAGMLMLIGLGWGWQFLPCAILVGWVLAAAMRLVRAFRFAQGWSPLGFGLVLATLLILLRWSEWQSAWETLVGFVPGVTL